MKIFRVVVLLIGFFISFSSVATPQKTDNRKIVRNIVKEYGTFAQFLKCSEELFAQDARLYDDITGIHENLTLNNYIELGKQHNHIRIFVNFDNYDLINEGKNKSTWLVPFKKEIFGDGAIKIGEYYLAIEIEIENGKGQISKIINNKQSRFNNKNNFPIDSTIKRLVDYTFENYRKYASLLDKSGEVSQNSMDLFKSLFENNAKVVDDLKNSCQLVHNSSYRTNVYLNKKKEGVKFKLNKDYTNYNVVLSDTLEKVYRVTLETTKDVFNNSKKGEQKDKYELQFVFYVYPKLKKAKIYQIVCIEEIEEEENSFAIEVNYNHGLPSFSPELSTLYSNEELNFDLSGKVKNYALGIVMNKENKPYGFRFGVGYTQYEIENKIDYDYSIKVVDENDEYYTKVIESKIGIEQIQLNYFSTYLGAYYSFLDTRNIKMNFNFNISGLFHSSNKVNSTGRFSHTAVYSYIVLNEIPEYFGEVNWTKEENLIDNTINNLYFIQPSLDIIFPLTDRLSTQLKIRYNMSLNNTIQGLDKQDIFLEQFDGGISNITTNYTQHVKLNILEFGFGILFNLN